MQNQLTANMPEWTILKLLKWTNSYFHSHKIDSPRAASEILLAHALGLQRIDLYLQYDKPLSGDELKVYKSLIKRRVAKEPVAYIVGFKEFWSMDIEVTRDVLIPRPETECLIEALLSIMPKKLKPVPLRLLDLGTGSGVIILAIAAERPGNLFFASDISKKALNLALRNGRRNNLDGKIFFFCGDWFSSLNELKYKFDIIVSNPPYIKKEVIPTLQSEIYRYEPLVALDGGKDGLDSLKFIISRAHAYLNDRGYLLLEMGDDQLIDVENIIQACGKYDCVKFLKDYSGYNRIVSLRKKVRRKN